MKRILFAILTAACALGAEAENVTFPLAYFTSDPFATNRIIITPTNATPGAVTVIGGNIIMGQRKIYTNDASGILTVSNMVAPQNYWVECFGKDYTTRFLILVTNSATTLNATNLIVNWATNAAGQVSYTAAESDAKYIAKAGDTMSGPLTNTVGLYEKSGSGQIAFLGPNTQPGVAGFSWYFTNSLSLNNLTDAMDLSTNGLALAIGKFSGDGSGLRNIPKGYGATLYVSKAGNDSTGARGASDFLTIGAAKAAALAGDVIVTHPGVYQEHNLLKQGVNYHFMPGVKLQWFCTLQTLADAYGFFDDRATGATTNIVTGEADCYFSYGTNFDAVNVVTGNTNVVGMVVTTTNSNTRIYADFHDVDGDCFADNSGLQIDGVPVTPALFYIVKTAYTDITVSEMRNTLRDWSTAQGNLSVGNGFYWQAGETYFNSHHISPWANQTYAIWPNNIATDQHKDNFWVRGGNCEGYIYVSVTSTNIRNWFQFDELKITNSVAGFSVIGGKNYLNALKISAAQGGAINSTDAETWVTAQKITAPASGGWVFATGQGQFYIQAQHYEAVAGPLSGSGGFFFSPSVKPFKAVIDGGEALCDGLGIKWFATGSYDNTSRLIVKNLGLNTSAADHSGNNSMLVETNGVTISGCRLVAPASVTQSITTTTPAQTVGVYWSAGNKPVNASITFSPNAGYTLDSNVK